MNIIVSINIIAHSVFNLKCNKLTYIDDNKINNNTRFQDQWCDEVDHWQLKKQNTALENNLTEDCLMDTQCINLEVENTQWVSSCLDADYLFSSYQYQDECSIENKIQVRELCSSNNCNDTGLVCWKEHTLYEDSNWDVNTGGFNNWDIQEYGFGCYNTNSYSTDEYHERLCPYDSTGQQCSTLQLNGEMSLNGCRNELNLNSNQDYFADSSCTLELMYSECSNQLCNRDRLQGSFLLMNAVIIVILVGICTCIIICVVVCCCCKGKQTTTKSAASSSSEIKDSSDLKQKKKQSSSSNKKKKNKKDKNKKKAKKDKKKKSSSSS